MYNCPITLRTRSSHDLYVFSTPCEWFFFPINYHMTHEMPSYLFFPNCYMKSAATVTTNGINNDFCAEVLYMWQLAETKLQVAEEESRHSPHLSSESRMRGAILRRYKQMNGHLTHTGKDLNQLSVFLFVFHSVTVKSTKHIHKWNLNDIVSVLTRINWDFNWYMLPKDNDSCLNHFQFLSFQMYFVFTCTAPSALVNIISAKPFHSTEQHICLVHNINLIFSKAPCTSGWHWQKKRLEFSIYQSLHFLSTDACFSTWHQSLPLIFFPPLERRNVH